MVELMGHYQDAEGTPGVLVSGRQLSDQSQQQRKARCVCCIRGAVGVVTMTLCGETVDTFDAQENN